jgi:imidazoleglycerol phosphate dehydratase HisB
MAWSTSRYLPGRRRGGRHHHSVEDVGIVLGQALAQALGDKVGHRPRYGSQIMPMDEALVLVALDCSGPLDPGV